MALLIIVIILLVIGIIADIVCSYYKNICTKATEQNTEILKKQNELLWLTLKESSDISKELIKINLEKDGEKPDEVS